ncbi:MAG: bifunctional phosphoribosylaminoimidazolecarboxamide formyltransferase/IMP cyclohydrolase, partial [Bowdeniella nasicola]|nr:bifunctional phosphoribosylaminoimidazolecarboxamide formyltransferase/IMP cyclohydrolase [Bowdeniella nasicola]
MTHVPITRALLSVYDKTGICELAAALHRAGVELLSTGSTAKTIAAAGTPVRAVEDVTGFPECLDGRVKTLHPAIHAGILADRSKPSHTQQLDDLNLQGIDLVVVNLYPFSDTVASGASATECIEKIDIGGPTMVRAAAKNHAHVAVVVDPKRYDDVAAAAAAGGFSSQERKELAAAAFRHTAAYDVAVANWMGETDDGLPAWIGATWRHEQSLRYGENPHQEAALYLPESAPAGGVAGGTLLGGKAMSYNNYVDGDAAWRAAWDHGDVPTCAIIKHTNPCGIAIGETIAIAHERAHACDPLSAFGGIIAVNRTVDATLAEQIKPIFTEVVIAPAFADDALAILREKINLRLLQVDPPRRGGVELRHVDGGLLAQRRDILDAAGTRDDGTSYGDDPAHWQLVAGEEADEQEFVERGVGDR